MTDYPVYLEGQFVGYGYLETENAYYFGTLVSVYTRGEILVPSECVAVVLNLMNTRRPRQFCFSGHIQNNYGASVQVDNILVYISSVETQAYSNNLPRCKIELQCVLPQDIQNIVNGAISEELLEENMHSTAHSLCDRCAYYIPHPFRTCNAFHPTTGVSECPEFSPKQS